MSEGKGGGKWWSCYGRRRVVVVQRVLEHFQLRRWVTVGTRSELWVWILRGLRMTTRVSVELIWLLLWTGFAGCGSQDGMLRCLAR